MPLVVLISKVLTLLVEFANADKMPTYTALRASVIAPVRFMLLLVAGLVVDWIGLSNCFYLVIYCWIIAVVGQGFTLCNRLILLLDIMCKTSMGSW